MERITVVSGEGGEPVGVAPGTPMMIIDAVSAAEDLARTIAERDLERLRRKARVYPARTNRASGLDDRCERRLYLQRTAWEEQAPPRPTLQSIFDEGNLHEAEVSRRLSELGIRLRREQVSFEWMGITGHIDGDAEWYGFPLLIEIKSVAPYAWGRLRTAEDLRTASGALGYVRKWYGQIQLYLLGSRPAYEAGVLIAKNKVTGELKVIPIAFDLEYADALLRKGERVDVAVARAQQPGVSRDEAAPPYIEDADECRFCGFFGRACNPPTASGEGASVVTAEHLVEAARIWRETRDAARRHDDAERELKDALKGTPLALVADLQLSTKEVTVNYKAQPARTSVQQRVSIRVIGGDAPAGDE